MTADLVVRLRQQPRNFHRAAIPVDSDERQIARVGMAPAAREEILRLHANAHFHGRPAGEVHAGLHDDKVAEVNGLAEIDAVNGRGDHAVAAVPKRGDRGALVHHRQHRAAEHVPHVVGVLRHHEL